MKYIAIRRRDRDGYVQQLEKLSQEGGRVISAGMTANPDIKCFEWWAIVEKPDKAQAAPEAPKDEHAEVLEMAKKIKAYCNGRGCGDCPFEGGAFDCELALPANWRI